MTWSDVFGAGWGPLSYFYSISEQNLKQLLHFEVLNIFIDLFCRLIQL